MTLRPRSVRSRVGRGDWRDPAVRHVLADLGLPDDRLVRVVDVRVVRPDEAWVSIEVDGRQVVVGLRREPCAARDVGTTPDGWFRLLYLYEVPASGGTRMVATGDMSRRARS